MKIVRDKSIEDWAFQEAINNYQIEVRDKIHLSDLLTPRKAYFQRVLPKKPTKKEILNWMIGRAIEDKFLKSIGYEKGVPQEYEGIVYTPDMFFNFPSEFKTRRGWLAKEGEEEQKYDHYLKQLGGYCAFSEKLQGWLPIISFVERHGHKTEAELAWYRCEWEANELETIKNNLITMKGLLGEAIENHNFKDLPLCPNWMCGKTKQEVITLPFCKTCNKEFSEEWRIEKHIKSKAGLDHEVVKGIYKEIYEKECKWWDECNARGKGLYPRHGALAKTSKRV